MGQLFDAAGELNAGGTGSSELGETQSRTESDRVSSTRDAAIDSAAGTHPVALGDSPAVGLDHYRGVPAFGVLQHAAEHVPMREGIRYGDHAWTYEALNRDAIRCAAMLQRLGVKPGDRVAILLPNVPEFIIAANGIWRCGGVVVAISPLMVADEVVKLLRETDCRFVICLDLLSHLLEGDEVPLGQDTAGVDTRTFARAQATRLLLDSASTDGALDDARQ